MFACDTGHTPGNGFDRLAKLCEGSQCFTGESLGMSALACEDWISVERSQREGDLQQCIVECIEGAVRHIGNCRPSTAAKPAPNVVPSAPLDSAGAAERGTMYTGQRKVSLNIAQASALERSLQSHLTV